MRNAEKTTLNVVVLGASGMLGSELMRSLRRRSEISVRGTVRDLNPLPRLFVEQTEGLLIAGVDVTDCDSRRQAVSDADIVINAVGVIKQASGLGDRVATVELNALLPHQLAADCAELGSRLIHVSTDCVFSGHVGGYSEDDVADPVDFYGRSKLLGEVPAPALTLRTSIIGHELQRHASLVDWFLSQPQTRVKGFVNAVYSGVTTTEFANFLVDIVIPRPELSGLWHLASEPISKFDLLTLVARQYGWAGQIDRYEDFRCDRSMSGSKLSDATGYRPPAWTEMIFEMFENRPAWGRLPSNEEPRT